MMIPGRDDILILNYVKQRYEKLSLEVHRKNIRAIAFYQREGFSILSEAVDEDTDEKEYIMVWRKEN